MEEARSYGSEHDTAVRTARMIDMARIAHQIVTVNSWVRVGEAVLIICDHEVSPMIVEALAQQVYVVGALPLVMRMPSQAVHGQELPAAVAAAMRQVQVTYAVVSRSITHTRASQEARKAGVRNLGFSNITEDAMLHGAATADPLVLREIGAKLRTRLLNSKSVRVTSDLGTDVVFSVAGRRVRVGDGVIPQDAGYGLPSDNLPDNSRMFPDGEVYCCPLEETVEGTIVIDRWVQGIGVLTEPMTWRFQSGKCVSISGGFQALALERLLTDRGDQYSHYLGEFAIGTNPSARSDGNPHREGKKVLGAVHFALGTGINTGGKYQSTLHLDGTMSPPRIFIDNDLIFDRGHLLI